MDSFDIAQWADIHRQNTGASKLFPDGQLETIAKWDKFFLMQLDLEDLILSTVDTLVCAGAAGQRPKVFIICHVLAGGIEPVMMFWNTIEQNSPRRCRVTRSITQHTLDLLNNRIDEH